MRKRKIIHMRIVLLAELRGGNMPTGLLFSALLDEHLMRDVEELTPAFGDLSTRGEYHFSFTFQGFVQLFADIFLLRDNQDSMILRVARIFLHGEILWYVQVHE